MDLTEARDPGTEEGLLVIGAAVGAARRAIGPDLMSAYAIGSLGHGGFVAATSDVDLALLTDADGAEVPVEEIRRTTGAEVPVEEIRRATEAEVPGTLAERLSIFHAPWTQFVQPPPGSRFPTIDRLDLMRSGALVFGEDLRERFGVEPSREEVLDQAISAALVRHDPAGLRATLEAMRPADLDGRVASKLVLWPVRLLHTVATGEAAGNEDAVVHYRDASPPPDHPALAEAALSWRATGSLPDPEAALHELRAYLLPLYAEIYARLAELEDLPRADQIAERAAGFRALPAVRPPG